MVGVESTAGLLAFRLFAEEDLLDGGGMQILLESLDVQAGGLRHGEDGRAGEVGAIGVHGIMERPKLSLAMSGKRGSGGERCLGVYVEGELFEDQLHVIGIRLEEGVQLDDRLGGWGTGSRRIRR